MRVLIAETDLPFLTEMKQALEQAGHEVIMAGDGMCAWGYLADSLPPDLLVTRLHLGQGSPPGTALGLRAQSHRPPIPVIYIPATAELSELADAGHGAVLVRPFAATELVAAVNTLLLDNGRKLPS